MAIELSSDLAARYNAQLVLLHVADPNSNTSSQLYSAASRELEAAESSGWEREGHQPQSRHFQILEHLGHKLLRGAQEQAESQGARDVATIIEYGDAGERILHHARHCAADLIVMGSRGLGKLMGLIQGSVSHKVFHLAPCSCVTVRGSDAQIAFEGTKSIVVATDGSEQADKAVDLASEIAGKYGAKLVLLYVIWRGPSLEQLRSSIELDHLSETARNDLDPARHPIAEHVSSTFIAPVVPKSTLREIGQLVLKRGQRNAEAKGVRDLKLLLREGDPARAIANFAKREQADLIAMGSRGLGGAEGLLAGSVSYKVTHTAHCSCMIVR